jgi:hypothetical protein
VETEHGLDSEAPADERAGNRQAQPKPPRHISTLPLSQKMKVGWHHKREPAVLLTCAAPEITLHLRGKVWGCSHVCLRKTTPFAALVMEASLDS